tara:strand:+ start:239 stop:403 length:165 start_codon:yes stop_codon:yes gene_type:complete
MIPWTIDDRPQWFGIVIQTDVNLWGEETIPTGIEVHWGSAGIETISSDEIEVVN